MLYWVDQTPHTGPVFLVNLNMKPRTVRGLLCSIFASKPGTKFRIIPVPGFEDSFDSNIMEFESKISKPMIKQLENGCIMYRLLLPDDDPADFTVIDNPKPPGFHRDVRGRITGPQRHDARGQRGPERKYDTDIPK